MTRTRHPALAELRKNFIASAALIATIMLAALLYEAVFR
jgi:hypothetical protein